MFYLGMVLLLYAILLISFHLNIMTVGIGASILLLVVAAKYKWDHSTCYVSCSWCGKGIHMYRMTYNSYLKMGEGVYCSGRCRRTDESSEGVKEKRYRIIDHE